MRARIIFFRPIGGHETAPHKRQARQGPATAIRKCQAEAAFTLSVCVTVTNYPCISYFHFYAQWKCKASAGRAGESGGCREARVRTGLLLSLASIRLWPVGRLELLGDVAKAEIMP